MFKKAVLSISSLAITIFIGLGIAAETPAEPATTNFIKCCTSKTWSGWSRNGLVLKLMDNVICIKIKRNIPADRL